MKQVFALIITIVLFSCKDKVDPTETVVSPGLEGTYSKTYTLEEYEVFRFIFPNRKTIQQTVTVVITETAKDEYKLDVILFGTAKKDKESDINFGLTAEMKQSKSFQDKSTLMFSGNFANLVPHSPDFNGTLIWAYVKIKDRAINLGMESSFLEDRGTFVSADIPKIK